MLYRLILSVAVFCICSMVLEAEPAKSQSFKSLESRDAPPKHLSSEFGVRPRKPPIGINSPYAILKNPTFHPGFFSAIFTVVGFVQECEKEGWLGYLVDFEDKGNFYEPLMGTNWWSYYFEPIYSQPPFLHDDRIITEDQKMQFGFQTLFENRVEVAQSIEKFIHVNENVQNIVDAAIDRLFAGARVIGLNYLRPERAFNNANVGYTHFFTAVDKLLTEERLLDARIFVSTDDEGFLQEVINHYGARVVYRNIPRYVDNSKPFYNSSTPNYDRGLDEIVECLLLAECEAIVRTNSHISTAASFFNPTLKFITVRPSRAR